MLCLQKPKTICSRWKPVQILQNKVSATFVWALFQCCSATGFCLLGYIPVDKKLFKVRKKYNNNHHCSFHLARFEQVFIYWNKERKQNFWWRFSFVIMADIQLASQQNSAKANQVDLTIFCWIWNKFLRNGYAFNSQTNETFLWNNICYILHTAKVSLVKEDSQTFHR